MTRFLLQFCIGKLPASLVVVLSVLCSVTGFAEESEGAEDGTEAKLETLITIDGEVSFSEATLHEALLDSEELIKKGGLTPPRADDAAFYMERFYRDHGFANAIIDWEITNQHLILKVTEGDRVVLGEVTFEGEGDVSDTEKLSSFLLGSTRARFSRYKDTLPFVRDEIVAGVTGLESYYHSQGYMDVVVEIPALEDSLDRRDSIALVVQISEGSQYTFGKPQLQGDLVVPLTRWPEEVVDDLAGHYSELQVRNAETSLRKFYQQEGYYSVEIHVQADLAVAQNFVVPVVVDVSSGPLYRFGKVTLEDVEPRVSRFVAREFSKLEGHPYSRKVLRDTYRKMLTSGVMGYFRVSENPDGNGKLDLGVTAHEAKTKRASLYLGVDTVLGGVVRFGYTDNNIFATTTSFGGWIEVAQGGLLGRISYRNPWFANEKFKLLIEATGKKRDWDGYTAHNFQLELALERKVSDRLTWTAAARGKFAVLQDIEIDPFLVGVDSYPLGVLALSAQYDVRDDPLLPSRGYVLGAIVEAASGGDQSFVRSGLRFACYIPLGKTVLSLGARAGMINAASDPEEISINERYFNGGPSSVRSFDYRELGPSDSHGYPIGGLVSTVFNVEYTVPLVGELHLATFVDAGSLTRRVRSPEPEDFRYAIGLGLRYRLPIGPLRIDYGINPNPRGRESSGAFHFAFGFAF